MSESHVNDSSLTSTGSSDYPDSKRKVSRASLPATGISISKGVGRRASKACRRCRARKVRCNVVEGFPCTNCRLDKLECIDPPKKRKRKYTSPGEGRQATGNCSAPIYTSMSESISGIHDSLGHTPHQDLNPEASASTCRERSTNSMPTLQGSTDTMLLSVVYPDSLSGQQAHVSTSHYQALPAFIRSFPSTLGPDDLSYLAKKGALTIPPPALYAALLECFVENIYPFTPLLNIYELIHAVDNNDANEAVSLLLFQAIMFASVASVDMSYLHAAGYKNRKAARREFFMKTRLLYDFDYEADRISVIQTLLLMTFWYETPDDQKDSHHWMGIAVSLCHSIGIHRELAHSDIGPKQRRIWKRIWWAIYMHDRFVALGMRRPTRIKNEEFDIPMLTMDDFELTSASSASSCISRSCKLMHEISMQRDLAIMCIEMAKLCICISRVLSTQYSVHENNHKVQSQDIITHSSVMLAARKDNLDRCSIRYCEEELEHWKESIAPEARYKPSSPFDLTVGRGPATLHRSLLHMMYLATLSALHRPQVALSTATSSRQMAYKFLDTSRKNVRFSANRLTIIAQNLDELNLIRCLPTSGITVLLPAIIIHLLDVKAPDETIRKAGLQSFSKGIRILNKLRDIYVAADHSIALLRAAVSRAGSTHPFANDDPPPRSVYVADLCRMRKATSSEFPDTCRSIPPLEHAADTIADQQSQPHQQQVHQKEPQISTYHLAPYLDNVLASSPQDSAHTVDMQIDEIIAAASNIPASNADFDTPIDLDSIVKLSDFDGSPFSTLAAFYSLDSGCLNLN
ncbi:hypothetical protein D6D01_09820 [Aureobasidium pullulans]|uniref:Zn(2)-C6 fungal-type domain-containing protein n=1 Tax=Aureobasidium pullulans TaxID=5580 RepID=A0A4S9JYS7_AURPU|nr:hypothetical protein D6D01_09820 [Aureobasidium pullulans]